MILQALDDRGRPLTLRAGRVVVFLDDSVTPVAAAVAMPGGAVAVEQVADAAGRPNEAFARLLRAHGLDRALVLDRAPLRRLESFDFRAAGGT